MRNDGTAAQAVRRVTLVTSGVGERQRGAAQAYVKASNIRHLKPTTQPTQTNNLNLHQPKSSDQIPNMPILLQQCVSRPPIACCSQYVSPQTYVKQLRKRSARAGATNSSSSSSSGDTSPNNSAQQPTLLPSPQAKQQQAVAAAAAAAVVAVAAVPQTYHLLSSATLPPLSSLAEAVAGVLGAAFVVLKLVYGDKMHLELHKCVCGVFVCVSVSQIV